LEFPNSFGPPEAIDFESTSGMARGLRAWSKDVAELEEAAAHSSCTTLPMDIAEEDASTSKVTSGANEEASGEQGEPGELATDKTSSLVLR
jgi:hypothetical protein